MLVRQFTSKDGRYTFGEFDTGNCNDCCFCRTHAINRDYSMCNCVCISTKVYGVNPMCTRPHMHFKILSRISNIDLWKKLL